MPLQFGAATSDTVDVANSASIQSLDPFSYFLIAKPTTLTSGRTLMHKGTAAANSRRSVAINGPLGNVGVTIDRATLDVSYVTGDTPLSVANIWYVVLVTFSSAATPTTHIYTAKFGGNLIESTYSGNIDGSGALGSDAADVLAIGCNSGHNSAFQGLIDRAADFNAVVSVTDIQPLNWRKIVAMSSCVGAWRLGANGRGGVLDETGRGNHGTITGAIPTSDVLPSVGRRRVA